MPFGPGEFYQKFSGERVQPRGGLVHRSLPGNNGVCLVCDGGPTWAKNFGGVMWTALGSNQ
jgi:hypothetical protein